MNRPNWLFLTCSARSGSTLIFSLLDGHPDIVTWPFEFRYFQEFFVNLSGDSHTASSRMLAEHFIPLLHRFHEDKFSTYYSSINVQGTVDAALLEKRITNIEDRQVTAEEFLAETYDLYASCLLTPPKAPRYNLVKTMIKGFDWRNQELIERGKFIYMVRPVEKRYASQRSKFIEKFHCGPVETFEKCVRLFFEMKLAQELEEQYIQHPNFLFIDMPQLQSDPNETMKTVANFLKLPFTESMVSPTFLGKPFGGHFHDPSLNKGGVHKMESKHTPLTSYEETLLIALTDGELPAAHELDQLETKALEADIPKIFPTVSQNELAEIRDTLRQFRMEVEKLLAEPLMNMPYTEWKRKFPQIQ